MNDTRTELVEKIYELYKSRGFVKEDEILDFASGADLSILDTNRLTEAVLARGVVIRDDAPQRTDDFDASKIDYNALFDKVIENSPELINFINYVRKIQPPQLGEWASLMSQVKNGNRWAYNRLFEMNLRVVIKTALYFSDTYDVALADAIQDGCIGLMYAIENLTKMNIIPFLDI